MDREPAGERTAARADAKSRKTAPGSQLGRNFVAYSDGASRGNPGPASIGGVVFDESGASIATVSRRIGHGTNNVAEYRAAVAVVEAAIALGADRLELRMDSELVVRQLNGRYRVRNPALMQHFQRLVVLRRQLSNLNVVHVPREQNKIADGLANQALDSPER
jgi:ribonuclease HI